MKDSKSMRTLLFAILGFFLLIIAGLIGLLYVKTKSHLMDYDVSINKYTEQNKLLKDSNIKKPDVVFIGNSITEQWSYYRPGFISTNNYLNRGIGGQTTPQMLLRFRSDVVDLKPQIVVIAGGINDIAENTGRFNIDFTINNITSMADIAVINGIKVVLISVLPATSISWNHEIKNVSEKIIDLNNKIKALAKDKGYAYVDLYSILVSDDNKLNPIYSVDGVHINAEAYKVMEPIIKKQMDILLNTPLKEKDTKSK